jgi:hypothetical protein
MRAGDVFLGTNRIDLVLNFVGFAWNREQAYPVY